VFLPEIDDEVVIGFLNDDPRQPIVLGSLHSSANATPIEAADDNHKKGYTSREKMLMIFDDEKKEIVFETPGGNKITISDDKKGIVLEDMNKNTIEMNDKGIKITSKSAIEISASTDLKIGGANINTEAKTSLELKASASAKLDGGGMLEVKGGTVKIN